MPSNLHEDTSYKYRWDQKELLGKILSGTLDEDLRMTALRFDRDMGSDDLWKRNPVFRGTCFAGPHKLHIDTILGDWNVRNNIFGSLFFGCVNITEIIFTMKYDGHLDRIDLSLNSTFYGAVDLEKVDVRAFEGAAIKNTHNMCLTANKLKTVILRSDRFVYLGGDKAISGKVDTLVLDVPSVVGMPNYSNITGTTAFKEGGTGGTIYIPKALYDHLGDGSEYDYKAATNWSTIDSYGTITWAQIEGSEYEL